MKHNCQISFLLLLFITVLIATNTIYGQTIVGTWQNPSTTACPFQQSTLVLSYTAAENVTGLAGQTIVGANLIQAPSLDTNNRTITLIVQWTNIEDRGSVVLDLVRTVGTTASNAQSPVRSVGLRNFYSRPPLPINGINTYNLPVCSGGQPITLSVPTETYAGISSETITDYLWTVPSTWGVTGAGLLTFSASGFPAPTGYRLYRAGNSISVVPAVGEGNRLVLTRFYSRTCSETYSSANPIVSLPRQIDFIREPTLTVTNVPASVKCGETQGFTPQTTVSQVGTNPTFTYAVPAGSGWYTNSLKGVFTIVPSGSGGTTLTVTPTYNCSGTLVVGTPKNVVIGFNQTQAAPVFTTQLVALCPGQSKVVGFSQVPGATSYTWSGITPPLTLVQTNPANWFATIYVPANLTTAVAQTIHVVANSGSNCQSTSADLPVKAGYGRSSIDV